MSFILYTKKNTGGFVVEAALARAGAGYEAVHLDYKVSPADAEKLGAINPMRQVPALILPDGTLMTESAAIVLHLAAVFPDKGLAPKPGTSAHARFLRWLIFLSANVYETNLRWFYSDRYTTGTDAAGVKAAAEARLKHCFAILETALDPFVAGSEISIADAYLAMLAAWLPHDGIAGSRTMAITRAVVADHDYGAVWVRYSLTA